MMFDDIREVEVEEQVGEVVSRNVLVKYEFLGGVNSSLYLRMNKRVECVNDEGRPVVYLLFDKFLFSTFAEAAEKREEIMLAVFEIMTKKDKLV